MKLPETREGRIRLVAVLAGMLVLFGLYKAFAPTIDAQQLLADVSNSLGKWTYLLVGGFAFLETGAFVGLVAPGETAVILGGAVAGQGVTSVWLTTAIVWAGAFAGDSVSYVIGRKLGRGFIIKHGPRVGITRARLTQVEDYFERHGGKTILIGRFVGLVRALAPFIAGSSGMRYRAMAPFSILGTGLWAATFTLLGYFASQNIDSVVHAAEQGASYIAFVAALAVGGYFLHRHLREPGNRERVVSGMEARRGLREVLALGRRARPQARFLWQRLTPGGLGLEFTTLIAAVAVGAFVAVGYATELSNAPGPTTFDQSAFDAARNIESGFLTALAKVVTFLGSGPTVALVGVLAAGWLASKRYWLEAGVIVVSLLALFVSVPIFKDAIDRPRPLDRLAGSDSAAYPSGHATYSVLYAWLAASVTVRLRPGLPGGAALLAAGLSITALIGATRVYLRVHWLSDVVGGWAFGLAVFAAVGAVALLIHHLRQNDPGADSSG